jgi:hypothetical protein
MSHLRLHAQDAAIHANAAALSFNILQSDWAIW